MGVEGSNPFCSTPQSLDFRTSQRIARNARVCARFAIMDGPGERLGRRKSAESRKTYPGANLLGPRIIASHSPSILRATDLQIIAMHSPGEMCPGAEGPKFDKC